jgi:hypothetical protein
METVTQAPPTRYSANLSQFPLRDSSAFRNFAIVWAMASLFHMAHSGLFDTRLNLALLTIAALYVLFRPSISGFIALVLLQLLDVVFRMPNVTNHWLFTALVNLTILHCVLYAVYKKRSFDVDETEVYNTFAPVARIEVLILYGWAVFHKFNSGFFSPEVSCATELLKAQHLNGIISLFPQITFFNAYFTIVVELAILAMLPFHRTRNAGILLGFIFHLVLSYSSYNAFFDFTSMIIAAYFLFTNHDFNSRVDQWKENIRLAVKSFFKKYSFRKLMIACLSVLAVLAIVSVLNKILKDFRLFHLYFFWTLYGLTLTYILARFLFVKNQRVDTQKPFALRSKSFLILPLIVFLNGASPYLGLKTENSYAMFSNLRTEGGITNHYIVPASLQVFGYQSDMVEIVSSSDVKLHRLAEQHQLMVLFEFKNHLQKYRPEEVTYRLNGELHLFRKTGELNPNHVLLSRLMKFRTISKYEPQPCAH